MKNSKSLLTKIEMSLDTMRPYLEKDGGNIEVVSLTDENVLSLKFTGNCSTCSQTTMTSAGIEAAIKNYISDIKKIIFIEEEYPVQ